MKKYRSPFLLLLVFLASCQPKENADVKSSILDFDAISSQLIKQMALQPGEKVMLMASPGEFDTLVYFLENKISAIEGVYLGTFNVDSLPAPATWETDFIKAGAGKSREELAAHFQQVDLAVMLPGAVPAHQPYAAMQDVLKGGKGRTIHFHWSGAYALTGAPMEVNDSISAFYQRVLLQTDYARLALMQGEFEKAARSNSIHVTTPGGTDIRFNIGDRPVTKQDGNASAAKSLEGRNLIDREIELPAGAIRVAPLEETVEGTIAFPDSQWSGQDVKGLLLTFKKGKVVDSKATSGLDAAKEELEEAGDAGKSFRELAIGFNPLLAIPTDDPWIPYYGYGAGVVRLSLGDNSELGGNVKGNYVRWNFFSDCTVTIGEDTWVKDGKLVKTFDN